jgi:fibronectin-binding autotransporter adhesin
MTADSFSATLGYLAMGTGNDNNTWGALANASVFQVFEDAIANILSSIVTGGTLNLTTNAPPNGASPARYAFLDFTGALASTESVVVPNLSKMWMVRNRTSGSQSLIMGTPTPSTTATIPQNSGWQVVICDGANNITCFPFNTVQVLMGAGSAAAPSYSNASETNSGFYRNGTNDWRFSIGGVDLLKITGAGGTPANAITVLAPATLSLGGSLTVPGITLTTNGVTVTLGGITVNGGGITVASGAASFAGGVTVTAGGATIAGGEAVTGGLTVDAFHLDTGTKTATGNAGQATLNKMSGIVTTESLTIAGGSKTTYLINNSNITSSDVVLVEVGNGTNSTAQPSIGTVTPGTGSVSIAINNTAATSVSGTLKLFFAVLKN